MLAKYLRLREGRIGLRLALLAAGSAALAIPACSSGGGGGGGHGNNHHHSPIVYVEAEPNNHTLDADFIGSVDTDSLFFVDGFVQAPGGSDVVDYFEFFATEPVTLKMYLEGFAAGADLDLCVYDPELDLIVACFESPYNPEQIEIVVHEPGRFFQVFIEAFSVDSEYTLEVVGHPYYWPLTVGEGEDAPAISVGPALPGKPALLEIPALDETDADEREETSPGLKAPAVEAGRSD